MKAVFEIIFAIILLVGGVKVSESVYRNIRYQSLKKVQEGLPGLVPFTKALTKNSY